MHSDSDDEPLSIIAALKSKNCLELELLPVSQTDNATVKKKNRRKPCDISIEIKPFVEEATVVERPTDVWLYLKDFNAMGPYSCLLCSEWFVNKAKIIIHYVVNHQKDYCGICRYFVPNREAWWAHLKFHTPWKCSQCSESFMTQAELRDHFSGAHNLIHCRLCHLRLPDDEHYNTHLYQKHSITNVSSKYEEVFWDFEYEGTVKFLCLLCTKPSTVRRPFADHFMSYHHFTLKCLMLLISGTDLPIDIKGVEVTPDFIDTQLTKHESYGYVELEKPLTIKRDHILNKTDNVVVAECDPQLDSTTVELDEEDLKMSEVAKTYKGDEDFDVTLVELMPINKCYYNYINEILVDIKANTMPQISKIEFTAIKASDISCCFCNEIYININAFVLHMSKMHFVRTLPIYTCRICATVFHSATELQNHISDELSEFDDLWICQFCDKEFNNRQDSRKHLTEHWNMLEYDNCFSPHMGFKCMFCPTLFWNETDREMHHVRVHFQKHKSDFYKCELCDELFSDKVWFIHHHIEKHNEEGVSYLLKCCICCVVLANGDDMKSHFMENHPEARKIFCSLPPCKYKPFSHKKSFQLHVKSVHNPATRTVRLSTCNICGLQFPSARSCSSHIGQKHGPGRFKCTICKEMLRTSDERKIHYLLRHPGRYQYQCPFCDKSFQYKSSLYMHKQDHEPHKKDYTCSFCGKVFMKKDSYREHMHIHQAPRHACSYCPMRFVQRSNMLRHERRHTGERPYACRWCPRTFADKGACTSHSRTHQRESAYTCMYCGQNFVQKSKLTYHIRKHTGENLETCTVCSKTFTSGCSLREHMKVHVKDKPKKTVKCPLCKHMYSDDKTLVRHMRLSHTRGRHACPLCERSLTTPGSLRDHLFTHSSVTSFRCRLCPKSYHTKKTIRRHIIARHGLKPNAIKTNEHYHRLEPRECNLGLDDAVMDKIFGPPKRYQKTPFGIITIPSTVLSTSSKDARVTATDAPNDREEQIDNIQIKIEPTDPEEEEPKQPDFVNVKIEYMDENDELSGRE